MRFEHRYVLNDPENMAVQLSEEGLDAIERFLSEMDEDENETHVYHNAEID